jgi:hypothetical protein
MNCMRIGDKVAALSVECDIPEDRNTAATQDATLPRRAGD